MSIVEVKPPHPLPNTKALKIFLGGSIEQGKARLWHADVIAGIQTDKEVVFLNPRRDEWDPTWVQSITNPAFNYQVNWELDGIYLANIIFFYFQPDTLAPITLAELATVLERGGGSLYCSVHYPPVVVCPDGYWRKGNVEIMCQRRGVTVYNTLEEGIAALQRYVNHSR